MDDGELARRERASLSASAAIPVIKGPRSGQVLETADKRLAVHRDAKESLKCWRAQGAEAAKTTGRANCGRNPEALNRGAASLTFILCRTEGREEPAEELGAVLLRARGRAVRRPEAPSSSKELPSKDGLITERLPRIAYRANRASKSIRCS